MVATGVQKEGKTVGEAVASAEGCWWNLTSFSRPVSLPSKANNNNNNKMQKKRDVLRIHSSWLSSEQATQFWVIPGKRPPAPHHLTKSFPLSSRVRAFLCAFRHASLSSSQSASLSASGVTSLFSCLCCLLCIFFWGLLHPFFFLHHPLPATSIESCVECPCRLNLI